MAEILLLKRSSPALRASLTRGAGILFYVALISFLFSLLSFVILFFYNRSQTKVRNELVSQIESKQEELRPELINQIFTLDSQLESLLSLLSNRLYVSNILRFLEGSTLSKVAFLNLDFDAQERKIEMSGEAAGYATLSNQITLLEGNPLVEKVEFGGINLGAGNLVNFKILIRLKPELFRISPQSFTATSTSPTKL